MPTKGVLGSPVCALLPSPLLLLRRCTSFYETLGSFSKLLPCWCQMKDSFPGGSDSKASACNAQSLGQEDPLEKEMAPHSRTLAWKIPWMEEPGGLQSTRSQRVGPD